MAIRVEVKGLSESVRALARMPRVVDQAADDAMRDEATRVARAGKRAAPGVHPSSPSSSGWIQQDEGTVSISKAADQRAVAAEFGMTGPSRGQYRGSRRQFRRYRARGYVIGAAIEGSKRKADDRVADTTGKAMSKTLTRAGVPRG